MPSGQDVAGALAQIQGIAANNGIAIGNIAVTPPAIQTLTAASKAASPGDSFTKPLDNFTFKLSASGNYESFKNFLSEIGDQYQDIRRENRFSPAGDWRRAVGGKVRPGSDLFNYTITVATYYQSQ